MSSSQLTNYSEFLSITQSRSPSRYEVRDSLQSLASDGNIILTAIYDGRGELHAEVRYNEFTKGIEPPISSIKYVAHSMQQGAVEIQTFRSDNELKEYCINELIEYSDLTGVDLDNIRSKSIDDIIRITLHASDKVQEEDAGYSLRSVVKGHHLKIYE